MEVEGNRRKQNTATSAEDKRVYARCGKARKLKELSDIRMTIKRT
jgi:hypothetical protein